MIIILITNVLLNFVKIFIKKLFIVNIIRLLLLLLFLIIFSDIYLFILYIVEELVKFLHILILFF